MLTQEQINDLTLEQFKDASRRGLVPLRPCTPAEIDTICAALEPAPDTYLTPNLSNALVGV
ncbi:MAG: hypothetical protein RB191_12930 [Terriglobia bacterium]|nr:hypothetical protein [Terriglobia bacterium]